MHAITPLINVGRRITSATQTEGSDLKLVLVKGLLATWMMNMVLESKTSNIAETCVENQTQMSIYKVVHYLE